MTLSTERRHSRDVPEIVRVILSHVARQRVAGEITPEDYEQKLGRLRREELLPNGLVLLERLLPSGRTRFLVKDAIDGEVRDTVVCGGPC